MTKPDDTRRNFLKSSGSLFGASWLAINMPLILSASETAVENQQTGTGYENLSIEQALELDALVNQIIPADETPGAAETGVVYFIDAALGGFMSNAASVFGKGLNEFLQQTKAAYPGSMRFSELSPEQQTAMLKSVEETPFFGMLHFLTLCGMFSMPAYGGNRGDSGWNLVGFDHRHAWQPPFGFYDAAVHGQSTAEQDET